MTKTRRFNFRCEDSFLAEIDDWRAKQRPVPSQSEAIRLLARRGAALENYLAVILKNSLRDLISAGVFSDPAEPEIYTRFQSVVAQSLDHAARLHQLDRETRSEPPSDDANDHNEALEKLVQDKFAPKLRQYSR